AEVQRAHNSEARVRFEYGTQLAAQGQYTMAINEFETITAQFADTSYVARAHVSAAKARYARAQGYLQTDYIRLCRSALIDFQWLASEYADTPEGAEAKNNLAAGADVTGTISGYLYGVAVLYLSKTMSPLSDDGQHYFSDDYRTLLDTSGKYTFH